MRPISPFLWFDTQAEEAANHYCSIFPGSRIVGVKTYGEGGPGGPGGVRVVNFELNGQPFTAMNGGPQFQFNEAVSFVIPCEDQAQVDHYWERLTDGGAPVQCGWLRDRYGVTWQVVPVELFELMDQPDRAAADRVMAAMMKMVKLDIDELRAASAAAG